jgi:hypothetical protein
VGQSDVAAGREEGEARQVHVETVAEASLFGEQPWAALQETRRGKMTIQA